MLSILVRALEDKTKKKRESWENKENSNDWMMWYNFEFYVRLHNKIKSLVLETKYK